MNLADLLVSYKQIKTPTRVLPGIPTLEVPQFQTPAIQPSEETKPSTQDSVDRVRKVVSAPTIKGNEEFEQAYDEVERTNPEAKKYRAFLTKMAQQESGFNKSIQNRAGAPAYGYFQFMEDGKKYNNISAYAGTDIDTFRNDPKLQIEAAIKLAKSFESEFNEEDRRLAQEKGFTPFGLLGGAWLGGVGGVRKFLKGQGNPSDRHWSKEGKGTDVASRIKMFNFRKGGVVKGQNGILAPIWGKIKEVLPKEEPKDPTRIINTVKRYAPSAAVSFLMGNINPLVNEIFREDNTPKDVQPLSYSRTLNYIKALENPHEDSINRATGIAKNYDATTAGYGTDYVNGPHRHLKQKIESGKWTIKEAEDTAVEDMRTHDKVIMNNMRNYTNRPDTISEGPRLLMAQARYHYGNIKKSFPEWATAVATGNASKQKELALKLSEGYNARHNTIKNIDIYGNN